MATQKKSVVVGAFHDASAAQEAVRALKKAGFTDAHIGVVSHDKSGAATATGTAEKGNNMAEGAAAGLGVGAGVGALWALGIAAGFMPVIGPVVAGGILGSVLASAAGGAAIAGVVGALIGLGIPEEDANYYDAEFKSGRTIVTVKADGRYDEAWQIMHSHGAYNREIGATATTGSARTAAATGMTAGCSTTSAAGGQTVKVHEEHLQAHKTTERAGEVHVRKEVHTEQQTIHVPVTREEVVIERRPAHGTASAADIRAGTSEIRIPVSEERVHVQKETVLKEEVTVGKRKVTGTEEVTGTVRKEEVKVVTDGDVNVRGDKKSVK